MTREESFKIAFSNKKETLNRKQAEYDNALSTLENENKDYRNLLIKLSNAAGELCKCVFSGDTKKAETIKADMEKLSNEKQKIIAAAGIKNVSFDCEKCKDTGYVSGKVCDCIKAAAKELYLSELSKEIPLSLNTFDNFSLKYYTDEKTKKRMSGIFNLAKEYAENFNPQKSENLLFMGGTGLGKTHLSVAIVGELIKGGFSVVYGSAYNLFSKMESEHFESHINDSYDAAIDADLLVIDDLGAEFVSPFIQTLLYNIINTRLLSNKPTLINTNLTISEINDRYTPRVASRLVGNYTAKSFLGTDVRQIKKAENR